LARIQQCKKSTFRTGRRRKRVLVYIFLTYYHAKGFGNHKETKKPAKVEIKVPQIDGAELRHRAEELLGKETETGPLATVDEPWKLRHELQVHQVELELQNAELRLARDELESALGQYTDLYDFAPIGYFTLDRAGTISRVNFMAAGLIGLERSYLHRHHCGKENRTRIAG